MAIRLDDFMARLPEERRRAIEMRAAELIAEEAERRRLPEGPRMMKVVTYEATVEGGRVKLPESVRLPEHATVYVVVPGVEEVPRFQMRSPRLARPEQAADFAKEVTDDQS